MLNSTDANTAPRSPVRLASIDAYRGFVMFLLMAEVLGFEQMAEAFPRSVFWQLLAKHQEHSDWVGCTLHDLIQPSFSFLVGVAVPFSLSSRIARGQSVSQILRHSAGRALILIFLGIFLRSAWGPHMNWTFEDTVTQIGLGYPMLVLLGFRAPRWQWWTFG